MGDEMSVKKRSNGAKLGILIPGLGAVGTTVIAGVELIRRGHEKPIGSLTQTGTIRLGKRDAVKNPLIKDFIPLASLDDIVFGGWDIFEETAYEAAMHAQVLESHRHIEPIKDYLDSIKPMKAVFDRNYVRRLDGPNVKKGENKYDLALMLMDDIDRFKADNNLEDVVMVWCASTEIYIEP